MTLALLCSGQGNQHTDMFALTADAPEAAEVFAAAARALDGQDPRILVRDPNIDIHENMIGQILCCTQALAAFAALRLRPGGRLIIAGYSVGELASWGCAGLLAPADVIALAAKRAAAMDAAGGPSDGLAYIRGLGRAAVDALCAKHDAAIAIVNPDDLFVIGSTRTALDCACAEALAQGAAKAAPLKVAVASHTPKLAAASRSFRQDLRAIQAVRPAAGTRLLSGIDAASVTSVTSGLDKLAKQISTTIDWTGCLQACAEAGMTAALELGPGHALATMVTAAYPDIDARSLDDFRSMDGVERWLHRSGGG